MNQRAPIILPITPPGQRPLSPSAACSASPSYTLVSERLQLTFHLLLLASTVARCFREVEEISAMEYGCL